MYEIFPNYFIKYYIIFKKYHLINVYGPENLLHKLTVALALGSPPCVLLDTKWKFKGKLNVKFLDK